VQLFGGNGVRVRVKVQKLYREIRAVRIYEGATEVQKVIVARELMKARKPNTSSPCSNRPATTNGEIEEVIHDPDQLARRRGHPDARPSAGERHQR
jgi:hypothetical protein